MTSALIIHLASELNIAERKERWHRSRGGRGHVKAVQRRNHLRTELRDAKKDFKRQTS